MRFDIANVCHGRTNQHICLQDVILIPDIEWMLKQIGAVKSDMEEPPKHEIQDMMSKAVRDSVLNNDSDSDGYQSTIKLCVGM